MSTYNRETKHPKTGKWENAIWADNYFGFHRYGVRFPSGDVFDPAIIELETRDTIPESEKAGGVIRKAEQREMTQEELNTFHINQIKVVLKYILRSQGYTEAEWLVVKQALKHLDIELK